MRVRCNWNSRVRRWTLKDDRTKRVLTGTAERVLLRNVKLVITKAGPYLLGDLEAVDTETGTGLQYHLWGQADAAYLRAGQRLGKAVSFNPDFDSTFVHVMGTHRMPVEKAEMAFLGHTSGPKYLPGILVFDPCDMTAEESARATR